MSASDTDFWIAAHRRVSGLQSDVQASALRAFKIIRDSLSEAELAKLIAAGSLDRLLAAAFSDALLARAALPVRQRVRQTVQRSFGYVVKDLPKAGKVDGVLAVQFNTLSPDVVAALQDLDTKALAPFTDEVRATIKAAIEAGLKAGDSPITIARELRDVVGLAPNQLAAVQNFRAALSGDSNASPLDYALRDKRFDARVAAGDLTETQIETMTAAYQRKMLAFHAETISRTATLDAYKAGQDLAWQNAIDAGIIDKGSLNKTWVGVMDDRERPEHVAMEGETVPFADPYSNGEYVPGESTYNCRCISRMRAA